MSKPDQNQALEIHAMKLRVYPSIAQENRLSSFLYTNHSFRNEAVLFLLKRRVERKCWIAKHPLLSKYWIPEEFAGCDINACSKWLTKRLEIARRIVSLEWGVNSCKNDLGEVLSYKLKFISKEERSEINDLNILTIPRTVLDQTLQDLKKTYNKVSKDLKENKKSGSKKKKAGFPKFRKRRFACSIRMQIVAKKNKTYNQYWQGGEIFIPTVGRLKFRDQGYVLPDTPPSLITLARDPAGNFFATFVCVLPSKTTANTIHTLPLDELGQPTIEGLDASLPHRAVSNKYGPLGRVRHIKRYERVMRRLNKSCSRKKYGSNRWKKAKLKLGALHIRVANVRENEIRHQAKTIAKRSAIVCIEDLTLAFMLQNLRLASSAHDVALGRFNNLLEQECAKLGHLLIRAPKFAATTQTCPVCLVKNSALKNNLSLRTWKCNSCNTLHDRDHAASINIQQMALQEAIQKLENKSGSENGLGALSFYSLNEELIMFIARGGLSTLLTSVNKVTREDVFPGSRADEPCILPFQKPNFSCMEQLKLG